MNTLIVDDRKENCQLLESLLTAKGHHVSSAANGKEALEILQAKKIDLIISDILMPVMDGFQLCRKVKTDEALRHIPFIIYTATYTGPKDEEFALKIGANRFVTKPCEPEKFLQIIGEVIAESGKKQKIEPPELPEEEVFKLYSERLIRKLEQKVEQVEKEMKARQAAEKAIRDSEENLRITLNSIGDAVIATDLQGRIIRMNPVAEKLCGWSFQEAKKQPLENVFNIINALSGEKVVNPAAKSLETGTIIGLANHTKLIAKNGAEYQISDSASPIKDENGNVTGVVLVFRDVTEDYYMRETLKENEDRLSKIMLAANDGMWDWDLKTNQVYFDPRYYTMAGYEVDEFPHRLEEFQKRIHPDDVDYVMNEAEKHLKGEIDHFDVKFRFRKKSGDWQWIQGKGIIVERDEKNRPQRFVGTHRDISELKQTELALKQEKAWSENIINNAPNIIVGLGERSIIKVFNHYAERLTGYKAEEVIGKEWISTFVPEELKETIYEVWDNIVENKLIDHHFENEIVTKSGEKRLIEWFNTILTENEEFRMILSIGTDISEKRQAEKKIRESEEKFRSFFETSNVGKSITLPTGEINVNQAFADMLGFSREELQSKTWQEITPSDEIASIQKLVDPLLKGEKDSVRFIKRYIHKNGSHIWTDLSTKMKYDEAGNPEYFITTIIDITDRIKAEKELNRIRDNLEKEVAEKTKELRERIFELERFHDATIGRELRIKELRDEIDRLKAERE